MVSPLLQKGRSGISRSLHRGGVHFLSRLRPEAGRRAPGKKNKNKGLVAIQPFVSVHVARCRLCAMVTADRRASGPDYGVEAYGYYMSLCGGRPSVFFHLMSLPANRPAGAPGSPFRLVHPTQLGGPAPCGGYTHVYGGYLGVFFSFSIGGDCISDRMLASSHNAQVIPIFRLVMEWTT